MGKGGDRKSPGAGRAAGRSSKPVARASRAPGRRSLVDRRAVSSPADAGTDASTADTPPPPEDIAGAAIDNRGSGSPVPQDVRARVEPHLGIDLDDVRVHGDETAQVASASIGARAFTYGSDVFLGPGESSSDVELMAHELTHVAQQGAAKKKAAQAKVEIGAANSPAETEADQVAAAVTGGAQPAGGLLVDGLDAPAGQMAVPQFLSMLKAEVTAAASDELGPVWSAIGCPYIDRVFAHYSGRTAREIEAALRRYAPETAGATTVQGLVAPAVARVRTGVRDWVRTGEIPGQAAQLLPGGAPSGGARQTSNAVVARLGSGEPLESTKASEIGSAYGHNLSDVRVHTDANAARMASERGAKAFTVGSHIAFAAGRYRPGTVEGDALLAHEAAHVVQQKRAQDVEDEVELTTPGQAHERDADSSAKGVIHRLYRGVTGAFGRIRENVGPALESDLALQRCDDGGDADTTGGIATKLREGKIGEALGLISALNGSKAGDEDIRNALDSTPGVSNGAAYRGSVLLQLGPESRDAWSIQVQYYVMGVESGRYTDRLCPAGDKAAIVQDIVYKTEMESSEGGASQAEYRARFNAKWFASETKPEHHEVDSGSQLDSKGPRNARARAIFLELYNDPATNVKTLYDLGGPFRTFVDSYAAPDGYNTLASGNVAALFEVFEGQAKITASGITDPSYLAFRTKVRDKAAVLDVMERAYLGTSNLWQAKVSSLVEGPNEATTTELRNDLWSAVTRTPATTTHTKTEVILPEPELDAGKRSFLSSVSFAADKTEIESGQAYERVTFTASSSSPNPGLPIRARVAVSPSQQIAQPSKDSEWEDGKTQAEVQHTIKSEGAGAGTELTATLTLPPVRDSNFTPKTKKITLKDKRLDRVKREASVDIENQSPDHADGSATIDAGTDAKYFGEQLSLQITPTIPGGNPGLSLLVSGELRPPGRAAVTFEPTPFPSGSDTVSLGDPVIPERNRQPVVETIPYTIVYKDNEGHLVKKIEGSFKARKSPPGGAGRDRARMAAAWSKLRGWLSEPNGAMWKHMVNGGDPQQARVARAVKDGIVVAVPMIIRSDSADWIRAHRDPSEVTEGVVWASERIDNSSEHNYVDGAGFAGFSDGSNKVTLAVDNQPMESLAQLLTHEAIHSVDVNTSPYGDWESYKSEFRAYWLARQFDGYDTEAAAFLPGFGPKSPRARAIFEHLYHHYDYVKPAYDNNEDNFRTKVDNYLYPDGLNLTVSAKLQSLQEYMSSASTRPFAEVERHVASSYAGLSQADKRTIRNSAHWRDYVEDNIPNEDFGSPPKNKRVRIKEILHIPM